MTRSVLVVEDEPLIRMDAVDMLEMAGLDVVDFDRADEALDYAQRHRHEVAAVFTDINLPGAMDGLDLAVRIAREEPSILVLVTSGRYDRRPDALPDTVRFLKKPWLPLEVISTLQPAVET